MMYLGFHFTILTLIINNKEGVMQTTLGFYQAPRQYFNKYTIIRPPRDLSLSFPSPEKLNKKKSKEFGFSTCSFKPYESNNQTDEKSFEDPAILISESDES